MKNGGNMIPEEEQLYRNKVKLLNSSLGRKRYDYRTFFYGFTMCYYIIDFDTNKTIEYNIDI